MRDYSELGMNLVVFAVLPIYLLACAIQLSGQSDWHDQLLAVVDPPLQFCGLAQTWGVFAPSVPHANDSLRAVVTFEDGSSCLWIAPQPQRLPLFERMTSEPFRKWAGDNVIASDSGHLLYPDACRFVAWQAASSEHRPVTVSLLKKTVPIAAPGALALTEPSLTALYFYRVQPGDLR